MDDFFVLHKQIDLNKIVNIRAMFSNYLTHIVLIFMLKEWIVVLLYFIAHFILIVNYVHYNHFINYFVPSIILMWYVDCDDIRAQKMVSVFCFLFVLLACPSCQSLTRSNYNLLNISYIYRSFALVLTSSDISLFM